MPKVLANLVNADRITEGTTNKMFTATERAKLAGIAEGAEVNQNAFSTVAVSGQSNVVADGKTDTLTLVAGNNMTLTTDATGDSVTITLNIAVGTTAPASPYTGQLWLDIT